MVLRKPDVRLWLEGEPGVMTESTSDAMTVTSAARSRVQWSAVIVFLVLAYGLAWAIGSILWFTGGLMPGGQPSSLLLPVGIPLMFTPAIAALVVTRTMVRPPRTFTFLGLAPIRPVRRTIGYCLLGLFGAWAITFTTIFLAAGLGVAPLRTNTDTPTVLLSILPASLLTAVAALGEELGWRGFLLPVLRPLGTWPAILISGAVWGPWHAPLVLLGYNYGILSPVALIPMTVTTMLMGSLLAWLRIRSASVYPSSFAHGALNGSAGSAVAALLPATGAASIATILNWPGWIVMVVLIAALVTARTYRWTPQQPVAAVESTDRTVDVHTAAH